MYCLIRYCIYAILRRIVLFINFVIHHKRPSLSDQTYELSAKLESILYRSKPNLAYTTSGANFITWPLDRVHPQYVLKDTVSLYAIDSKEAHFIECPPEIDIYSSNVHPFLYAAQFNQAIRVIRMPLSSFHRLAKDVGKPTIPTVIIWNTGRCGSTLLNQIFEAIGGEVICMGEPDALTNLVWLRGRRLIDFDQYKTLLESSVNMILKPRMHEPRLMCLKTRSSCTQHLETFYEMFPQKNIKHIFLYRDPIPNCQSLEQSTMTTEPMTVWWNVKRSPLLRFMFPRLADMETTSFAAFVSADPTTYTWATSDEAIVNYSNLELWVVHWGIICAEYQRALSANVPVIGLQYDDLVRKPQIICEKLNVKLELRVKDIWTKVSSIMEQDSQRGSTLYSREKLLKLKPRMVPSDLELTRMESILQKLGVDVQLRGRAQLPNTLET